MSRISPFGLIRAAATGLLEVKSARGVSFTMTFFTMLGKSLGYLRTLIIAWAFGTSAAMDSYHAASGIVSLFAGGIGNAVESAVLPEMERVRKESGDSAFRSLFAAVSWFVILLVALLCAALAIAPGLLVRFVASGFDAERVRIGAIMIWWLVPYAAISMYRPITEVWALCSERYTLSSICSLAFNFVAIPALLLTSPAIGAYSVAACMSIGYSVTFIIFLSALKGQPSRFIASVIPFGSVRRIWANTFYSLLLSSSGTIYMIVDRYFASRLPVGSVAAISYGSVLLGLFTVAIVSPLTFFLAKMSRLVLDDLDEARNTVRQTISIVMAYALPVGFFTAVAARPIISLIFGWGSFDACSVEMTATCLAGYNIGLVFAIAATVVYRYAQALQRLDRMIPLIYAMLGVNTLLDWFMVGRLGLFGLALATSGTQVLSFAIYYTVIMNGSLWKFLIESKFFQQITGVALCALLVAVVGRFGMTFQFAAAAAMTAIYLLAAERAGIMPCVPPHWRPRGLAMYLASLASGLVPGTKK
ncbi:MAG: hypothetical protein LBS93_00570 [Synergistaceae bacterium]|jgi:putative peptidoglycan lipid II flippase|nr:hypothetical protein [Synergistaceae bacterium]